MPPNRKPSPSQSSKPSSGPARKPTIAPGGLKASLKPPPVDEAQPFVKPCVKDMESGCLYCPLAPFHHDFASFKMKYGRDSEKILAKEKEGHLIETRNVAERPYEECDVLFVGEAPGADEDKQGKPFVGRSGTLLRRTIEEVFGVETKHRIAITNLVRCRPPRNKDPTKTEIRSCSPELIREINARKPKLIVVLGNHSMEFLTGQSGITTLQGKMLESTRPDIPKTPVLPCLHPAYILRFDHEIDKFVGAIDTAKTFLDGNYVALPGLGEYEVITDIRRAAEVIYSLRNDGRTVAFDTETGSLSPWDKRFPHLLCFSFSNEAMKGYVIPFDHKESPWREGGPKEKERTKLIVMLRQFFLDEKVERIAQNEKFDRQHIGVALGIELLITNRDTMNCHLVTNETRGTHGLDKLAYEFTGMGGYDRPLEDYKKKHPEADPDKGGSYANIPGEILFKYAGADADCTWRVDKGILAQDDYKNNPRFIGLAEAFFPHLSACLADMELAGAQVNPAIVEKLDKKYSAEMAEAEAQIMALPVIKRFVEEKRKVKGPKFDFNPGSTPQLREVFFGLYGLKPTELSDAGFEILLARYKKACEEAKKKGEEEPSFGEIQGKAIAKKEWEFFSTKGDVLHDYERAGNELAPLILKYRDAQILHSTFVEPLKHRLDQWGRIHGSFLVHGTVTGRLSSRDPNLQNIPNKGGALIKQAYISRFGDEGVLLNVDFSQIELRIAASWFNEPKMKEVYRNNGDLHKLTAIFISGLTKEKFEALPEKTKDGRGKKDWRTRAKRVNFGSLYGGGPPALQTTLKKDGVFVTIDECKAFLEAFFKSYPGLKRSMDQLTEDVKGCGYLESFTGRRRRVPEVFSEDRQLVARAIRQSINFPIQSGAGDMTLMAMVLINRAMKREKMRSKLILTVHDSLVFDCHVDEFLQVAALAKAVMENIPSLSEEILPGLDWSWLDVPIVAECEVGQNWGQMVEFEPGVLLGEEEADTEKPLYGVDDKGKPTLNRKPTTIDELWECFGKKAEVAV